MVNFGQGGPYGFTDVADSMAGLAGGLGGMGKMRHDKKQGDESHAKALELAALRIKELEDKIAQAPAEFALRTKAVDAGIADRKDDNAIRRKALDDAAAARSTASAAALAKAQRRADAWAKARGILGGGALPASNPGGADPAAVQGPSLGQDAAMGASRLFYEHDLNAPGYGGNYVDAPEGSAIDAARANRYFPQAPQQGPVAPPMQGPTAPAMQGPSPQGYDGPDPEPDDDFDDETKGHLSETQNILAGLAPLMGDLDPEDRKVIGDALKERRKQGLAAARRNYTSKFIGDMVRDGSLDEQRAQQQLDLLNATDPNTGEALYDPEDVLKNVKELEKAHREQAIDDRMVANATTDAENLIVNLPALGVQLSRAQQYEIEQLREDMQRSTTPTKRRLAAADKIREKVFGWANKGDGASGGKAEKHWTENPLVAKWADQGLDENAILSRARALGIPGVPEEQRGVVPGGGWPTSVDAPAGGAAAGGGPSAEAQQGPDPERVREAAALRVKLTERYGREATPQEVKAEMLKGVKAADRDARLTEQAKRIRAQTAGPGNGKVVGHVPSEGSREFLKSAIGAMPKTQAEKQAALDHIDKLIDESSGGYREKLQLAREILDAHEVAGAR